SIPLGVETAPCGLARDQEEAFRSGSVARTSVMRSKRQTQAVGSVRGAIRVEKSGQVRLLSQCERRRVAESSVTAYVTGRRKRTPSERCGRETTCQRGANSPQKKRELDFFWLPQCPSVPR